MFLKNTIKNASRFLAMKEGSPLFEHESKFVSCPLSVNEEKKVVFEVDFGPN